MPRRSRMSCRAGVSCHTRSVSLHTTTVPSLNLNGSYCGENYSLCQEANNSTSPEELSELDGANPNVDVGQSTCSFVRIGPYDTPGSVGVEWSPQEPFCHVIVYYLLGPSEKSPVTCEHSWTESMGQHLWKGGMQLICYCACPKFWVWSPTSHKPGMVSTCPQSQHWGGGCLRIISWLKPSVATGVSFKTTVTL